MKFLTTKTLVSMLSLCVLSMNVNACEWEAKVKNLATQEIKYYQVSQDKETKFMLENQEGDLFAACKAFLQEESIKSPHDISIKFVEAGILMCAYAEAQDFPMSANASRFIFKDGSKHNNPVIINLFNVPDRGQKLKPTYEVRLSCRD